MSAGRWLPGVTALAAAVFGGAMFAFSAFVMPALRDLSPRVGIVAMQAINVRAEQSLLMVPMGVLALGSVATIVTAVVGDGADRPLVAAGALLGLAGVLITVGGNVPLNNHLASLEPEGREAECEWAAYLIAWTRWNHLRTVTCIVGAVLLAVAASPA